MNLVYLFFPVSFLFLFTSLNPRPMRVINESSRGQMTERDVVLKEKDACEVCEGERGRKSACIPFSDGNSCPLVQMGCELVW